MEICRLIAGSFPIPMAYKANLGWDGVGSDRKNRGF
jgi:hypothetical protein